MAIRWARTRSLNGKDVWIQLKRRLPWSSWFDWRSLASHKNKLSYDMLDLLDQVEDLMEQIKEEEAKLNAEIDDIKKASTSTMGYGLPFRLKTKGFFLRKEVYTPPPDVDWEKELCSLPNRLKKLEQVLQIKGGSRRSSPPSKKDLGTKHHYTLKGDKDLLDTATPDGEKSTEFREPRPQQQGKKKRGQQNNRRQHQPDD